VTVCKTRPGARWKHTTGDEVRQLRALQLSDRWAPAVRRATEDVAGDLEQRAEGVANPPHAQQTIRLESKIRSVRDLPCR
jgi:hypothetical protein